MIRISSNGKYDTLVPSLLSHLGGLLSYSRLTKEESSKLVFKSQAELAPDYMRYLFVKNSQACPHVLRNTHCDLRIPLLQTSGGKNSFVYRGAKLWNGLDTELKQIPALSSLGRKLKMEPLAFKHSIFLVSFNLLIVDRTLLLRTYLLL